jgi:hypothetical protein
LRICEQREVNPAERQKIDSLYRDIHGFWNCHWGTISCSYS